MFVRVSQLARHLPRTPPNYVLRSTAPVANSTMTSSTSLPVRGKEQKSMIHTAACLIIGDEVLGGKVGRYEAPRGLHSL